MAISWNWSGSVKEVHVGSVADITITAGDTYDLTHVLFENGSSVVLRGIHRGISIGDDILLEVSTYKKGYSRVTFYAINEPWLEIPEERSLAYQMARADKIREVMDDVPWNRENGDRAPYKDWDAYLDNIGWTYDGN